MDESRRWAAATRKGSRRAQVREALELSVRERLELLDELNRTADALARMPRSPTGSGTALGATSNRGGGDAVGPMVDPDGGRGTVQVREDIEAYAPADGPDRHLVRLDGCRPVPLASYLKALGILRLVSEQEDPDARGWWEDEGFVLWSGLDGRGVRRFLLRSYQPTPILAPWNGGSGFFPKDKTDAVEALEASKAERFGLLRHAIVEIRRHLEAAGLPARPEKDAKEAFLTRLRSEGSEPLLAWLDAAVVLSGDGAKYPPLLGTGGNDGRLEFSNNFLQRLVGLFDLDTGAPDPEAEDLLDAALFGAPATGLEKSAIGQFAPGSAGGPNASTGYSGDSRVNPWDFVLMLEGAVLFAARTSRRLEGETGDHLTFPFTVRTTGAGTGQASLSDEGDSRAETWVPLWSRPATLGEIRAILGEGRVSVGRRTARDGLDFVRAVAKVGVDRGIGEFQRFGYLMRAGRAYLATPLNRISVRRNPDADLIDQLEVENWLSRFRRLATDDRSPARLGGLARRLENSLFDLAKASSGTNRPTREALVTLGEIQAYLTTSPNARERCFPVPVLGTDWVEGADDGSVEFVLARCLAGLQVRGASGAPASGGTVLPMEAHLSPVRQAWVGGRWVRRWNEDAGHQVVWGMGGLNENLFRVLSRRLLEARRMELADRPLFGWSTAPLGAVAAWIAGQVDVGKIARLVPGLCLARIPVTPADPMAVRWPPPAAYGILKPLFTNDEQLRRAGVLREGLGMPLPSEIPRLLMADRTDEALSLAQRKLRVRGLVPRGAVPQLRRATGPRLLSTLLIPLPDGDLRRLVQALFDLKDEPDLELTTPTREGPL